MAVEEPSDEMLMRLADGELSAEDASNLRARIAAEPSLAARYALFSRTRRLAEAAFAPILDQPVPERLLAAIRAADAGSRRPTADVVPLPARAAPQPASRFVPLALAASVAALLAAPAGYLIGRDGGREAALRDPLAGAQALVAAALETVPSGTRRTEGALTVQPLASHVVGGDVCRDFRLDAPAGTTLGVACRESGAWRLRASVVLQGEDVLRSATADHPVIAAVLERLGAAPPMDADTEAARLRRGWR